MATLARKWLIIVLKVLLFIFLFCVAAKLIDASTFISYETSSRFSEWLYGFSSQDNFDDLWFFADVGLSLLSAIAGYVIVIKILRKVRR
ncbi:hypothetical protein N4G41_03870 [Kosakonia sacchari]|uniref:hypothetical protein n=1 Tax=Kosakonia sacchari TaxID=1158459 RepID=UPI002ACE68D2|nr:hypothetical protein [Kosakonia sacchari]MDZ7320767.1 hypothetical protein [Kosakonia sacchari]